MNSVLKLLIFVFTLSIASSLAQDQYPILQPSQGSALRPYTREWVAALEHLRNVAGGDYDDDWCPLDIPSFECVKEDDKTEKKRDAWSLRPQDIKAVIALGDSISAGFGMLSGRPPVATILEYRGKAFSSGADEGELTLANFLRVYDENGNPPIGAPSGITLPLAHRKELNFAISGSLSDDLPGQATRAIKALFQPRYESLRDEFKLVNILIGANNLCQACSSVPRERLRTDPDIFERDVRETVEKLRTGMGNVFVNLIGLFNVSNVYKAAQEDTYCRLIFDRSNLALCPCATNSDETRTFVDLLTTEYNHRLQKIAFDYRRGRFQKFAVVYQPALEEMSPGEFAQGFLSRFDCFHPNRCAHRVMALAIWNNMFSSPDRKHRIGTSDPTEELEPVCPRKGMFLQ